MRSFQARRLTNHDTKNFLLQVFEFLQLDYVATTRIRECDDGCFEIAKVPDVIFQAAEADGIRNLRSDYPRICFERALLKRDNGSRYAEYVDLDHPLLKASVSWVLLHWQSIRPECGDKLPVLVDESTDESGSKAIRVVYYVEWKLQNAFQQSKNSKQTLTREAQFIEIDKAGSILTISGAPYLGYRPAFVGDMPMLQTFLDDGWLENSQLSDIVEEFASEELVMPSRDALEIRERERIGKEKTEVLRTLNSLIAREKRQAARFPRTFAAEP